MGYSRFFALLGCSLLLFLSAICYDCPTSIEIQIESSLNISPLKYNLLYSAYSIPNMILPFFLGYLIDRVGTNVGLLIFTIIFIIGQGVFALSFQLHTYAIAFIGRIIYAIGDSNLSVASNSFLSKYFSGKEIAFALGVKSCLPRLGGIVINILQPIFYGYFQNLYSVFYITFAIASIAIIIVGFLIYFYKEERIPEEEIHLRDINTFPVLFWLLVVCCGFQYVCIFCFNSIASKMIQMRFNASLTQSSECISILQLIAGITSPIFGYAIDKVGQRPSWIFVSSAFLSVGHIIMLLLPNKEESRYLLPLILLGVGFGIMVGALWSSIQFLIQPRFLGIAYGVGEAVQNIVLLLFPIIIGWFDPPFDSTDFVSSYNIIGAILVSASIVSTFLSVLIIYIDNKKGHSLSLVTSVFTNYNEIKDQSKTQ